MKKIILFFLSFIFVQLSSFAKDKEDKQLDSLVQSLKLTVPDTVRLKAYLKILDLCELEDNAKFAQQAVTYTDSLIRQCTDSSKTFLYLKDKAKFMPFFAVYYAGLDKPDYNKTIEYYTKELNIYSQIKDASGMAQAYINLGNTYSKKNDTKAANGNFNLALKMQTDAGDANGAAKTYFFIGNLSYTNGNSLQGYFNYYMAILLRNKANQKLSGKIETTNLDAFNFEEIKASTRTFTGGIIGLLCGFLLSLGVLHFFLFLFYSSGKSNLYYSLYALISAGALYILLFNFCYPEADNAFVTSSFFQEILGCVSYLFLILFLYSLFYSKPPKFLYILLSLFALFLLMSVFKITGSSFILAILRITLLVELIRVVVKAKRLKKEGAQLFGIWMWLSLFLFVTIFVTLFVIIQKVVMYSSISLSLGWVYFLAVIFCLTYLNFSIVMSVFLARQVAKTNKGLERQLLENKELSEKMLEQEVEKKKILESQNEQLESMVTQRTSELQKQKEIVEEKNQEILDSISYAQRIQNAILPSVSEIQNVFPQSFVLFKPKDIVSGDFYWFAKASSKIESPKSKVGSSETQPETLDLELETIFIAVADCTGHGVPGAFMSTIGYEKLNEAVSIHSDVSLILQSVNRKLRKVLHQSGMEDATRDGMDVAICSFNKEMNELSYAGANRPFWIITPPDLTEIKATKTAIGGLTEDDQEFVMHKVSIKKGDTIYLFTDGYPDQFSPEDKKLMTKRFREILISIQHLGMAEQKKYLENFIEEWRGTMEQTDDMLVIGIRIS